MAMTALSISKPGERGHQMLDGGDTNPGGVGQGGAKTGVGDGLRARRDQGIPNRFVSPQEDDSRSGDGGPNLHRHGLAAVDADPRKCGRSRDRMLR